MYNDEIFNETNTEESCDKDYLPGTLECAYRQWKERKKQKNVCGTADVCGVNIMEEAHFHFLPYGMQICATLFMR